MTIIEQTGKAYRLAAVPRLSYILFNVYTVVICYYCLAAVIIQAPPAGLEPAARGLGNRCSIL
jgi:hypothetical protein